jgi:hypothetical protein
MRTRTWIVTALFLGIAAAPALAQGRHDGFWFGFGLGGGVAHDEGGGAGYFRLGGTPADMLLVGAEAIAWVKSENNTTVSQGNVTGNILFYPSLNGGFFLKTGLGFATVTATATSGTVTVSVSDQGFGTTFGAGYDIRLGRNLYLTPNADLLLQVISGSTETVFLFTVGLTWH